MTETTQTEDEIVIKIPVRTARTRRANIVLLEKFIKFNSPPDYFEAYLAEAIDEERSVCRMLKKEVRFVLKKKVPGLWEEVFVNVPKSETVKLKTELSETLQKINQEKEKEFEMKYQTTRRQEITDQVKRDSDKRERVERINKAACIQEIREIEVKPKPVPPSPKVTPQPKPAPRKVVVVPSVRQSATIQVDFSKHKSKLPKRESTQHLFPPEQKKSDWLKSKGDEFYTHRNFLSAISAYSEAIKIDECRADLYVNRGGAHFGLEEYQQCVDDCSKAIYLLEQNPPANMSKMMSISKARRGAAYCKLNSLAEGYKDMVDAVKEDPLNEALRNDCEMIRCKLESAKFK